MPPGPARVWSEGRSPTPIWGALHLPSPSPIAHQLLQATAPPLSPVQAGHSQDRVLSCERDQRTSRQSIRASIIYQRGRNKAVIERFTNLENLWMFNQNGNPDFLWEEKCPSGTHLVASEVGSYSLITWHGDW